MKEECDGMANPFNMGISEHGKVSDPQDRMKTRIIKNFILGMSSPFWIFMKLPLVKQMA